MAKRFANTAAAMESMLSNTRYALVFLSLLLPTAASAGMYKWVDEKGMTHYGDVIPPQYAGQGKTELNKRGVAIKKTDAAPTAEQIEQRAMQQELQKQQDQLKLEQKRKDMALLNTYTSAEEIDLARDRHVSQAELVIRSTETRLGPVDARLLDLRKQANALLRDGKPVPPKLEQDIKKTKSESQGLHDVIAQKRAEAASIRTKFDTDKKRFIELNQIASKAQ